MFNKVSVVWIDSTALYVNRVKFYSHLHDGVFTQSETENDFCGETDEMAKSSQITLATFWLFCRSQHRNRLRFRSVSKHHEAGSEIGVSGVFVCKIKTLGGGGVV